MLPRIVLAAGLCAAASISQAAPCDVFYQVQPEDRLSDISVVAYGTLDYQLIYSRNIQSLPSLVELPIGQEIVIPCMPGELGRSPDAVALTLRMLPLEAFTAINVKPSPSIAGVVASATQASGSLALLTANDGRVLAGENLPSGGIVPAIVQHALAMSNPPIADASLTFVDDKGAHLDILMLRAGFALSFPWHRPDCEQPQALTYEQILLCQRYVFSDPIFEEVYSVFSRSGKAPRLEDGLGPLSQLRICVPAGIDLHEVLQQGAAFSQNNIREASNVRACFDLMTVGKVGAVLADVVTAKKVLSERNELAEFEEVSWLGGVSSIYAIALRDDKSGITALTQLNFGLEKIKTSGEWFQIIVAVLSAR